MFSNYYANLLLFDEKSFLKFLRRLGFEVSFSECAEIICELKSKCFENNLRGSEEDFEIWVCDQTEQFLED